MHMADALLSPQVGVAISALSTVAIAYSVKKINNEESFDEKKIPIMAASGAFIFAAQMINFTIPGTGASGHIGGGVLLVALLGPMAALITMAAVLIIQCLFFADGGLLALGANIFNLGVIISFVVYPLIYKPILKNGYTKVKITLASFGAVIIGLQLGSLGVVIQTTLSNITQLPFGIFLFVMQPIHLAIGIFEAIITASILNFVYATRPEIMEGALFNKKNDQIQVKKVVIVLIISALIVGGLISSYASAYPDGLEWAVDRIIGNGQILSEEGIYETLEKLQEKTSLMPEYKLKEAENEGTPIAGILGGIITLIIAGLSGYMINFFKKRKRNKNDNAF